MTDKARADDRQPLRSLAIGVRAGDERAFRSLFEALYPGLVTYALGLSRGQETVEDFVQEAFVRLWQDRAKVDPDRSVKALLYVSVRNSVLNDVRTRTNRQRILTEMETADRQPPDDESYDTGRLRERLLTWINNLPPREQEAFRLSRFAELTHAEIGDVMSISKLTVEKHITNALRRLRDHIRSYDPDLLQP